jgi:ACT domain-containing protein
VSTANILSFLHERQFRRNRHNQIEAVVSTTGEARALERELEQAGISYKTHVGKPYRRAGRNYPREITVTVISDYPPG